MFVPFHADSYSHCLCCLAYQGWSLNSSQVWYIAFTLNADKTVLTVSQPDSHSVHLQRVGCRAAALALAAAWPWAVEWEGVSSSQQWCREYQIAVHWAGTVCPGADSFLTASVCVGGTHGHEHEWSYTGCAAPSLGRFRLADDSRENGWSIGVLLVSHNHLQVNSV